MRVVEVVEKAPNPSTMDKNYIWAILIKMTQYVVVFEKKFRFNIFFLR